MEDQKLPEPAVTITATFEDTWFKSEEPDTEPTQANGWANPKNPFGDVQEMPDGLVGDKVAPWLAENIPAEWTVTCTVAEAVELLADFPGAIWDYDPDPAYSDVWETYDVERLATLEECEDYLAGHTAVQVGERMVERAFRETDHGLFITVGERLRVNRGVTAHVKGPFADAALLLLDEKRDQLDKMIYDAESDEIDVATHWHGGQGSMFYAVSSTGSLSRGTIRPSWSASMAEPARSFTDLEWNHFLLGKLQTEIDETITLAQKQGELEDLEVLAAWKSKVDALYAQYDAAVDGADE